MRSKARRLLVRFSEGALVIFTALALSCSRGSSPGAADPISAALASPERSAADQERDSRDRPDQILKLADFRAGSTIADIFGGGGYYSEIIAHVVGPRGLVRLINNATYDLEKRDELARRLGGNRLPNVRYEVGDPADLKLGEASLDGALIVMSYHDLYFAAPEHGWPAIDASRFIDQIVAALKPGAALLIVDHAARPGSGNTETQRLHRIDEAFAKADFEKHGLKLATSSDVLRNPADDHGLIVFAPEIRGRTDRFVHLYRKPK